MLKTSQTGLNLIKEFEGLYLKCYHLGDGVCSIGWGHTRPLSQCPGVGSWVITEAQAEDFLKQDLAKAEGIVNKRFNWVNQNQFDALVSFVHNVGDVFVVDGWRSLTDLSYITTTMLKYVNPPQFKAGLLRRRQAEVKLFNQPINVTQGGSSPFIKGGFNLFIQDKDHKQYVISSSGTNYVETAEQSKVATKLWGNPKIVGKDINQREIDVAKELLTGGKK